MAAITNQIERAVVVESSEQRIVLNDAVEYVHLGIANLGLPGPPGPRGIDGDLHYTHNQLEPASEWVIDHSLNKRPAVHVEDSAGTRVEGDVQIVGTTRVIVSFSQAFGGRAVLN